MQMNTAAGEGRDTLPSRICSSVLEVCAFVKGNEYPKHAALSIAMIMNQES